MMFRVFRTLQITLLLAILALSQFAFGKEKVIDPNNPLAKFAKISKIDEFNTRIAETEKNNPKPKRGGQAIIRLPADMPTLNLLTATYADAQYIDLLIYDSLITRDGETLEFLPWIAQTWEIQDEVKLKDGKSIFGRITAENETSITFTENGKQLTIGKTDLKSYDVKSGEAVLKNGKQIKGKINDIFYTIEIEIPGAPTQEIKLADMATWKDETRKNGSNMPFYMKNVILIFHLRDDVKWHDGKPLTTDDVIFTYETIMNKNTDAASLRNYFNDIEKLETPEKNTLRFKYHRPHFASLESCGSMLIMPKHKFETEKFKGDAEGFGKYFNEHEIGNAPFGCGAYKFAKWEKGKQIVLEANRDYWACNAGLQYFEKEQPYLDKIIFTIINNKTAALKELQNGAIDVDFDVQPDIWFSDSTNSKEFKDKYVRAMNVTPSYTFIGWNEDKVFFKDKLVRQAMSHAIPTQKIIDDLYKGLATIVTGPFFIDGPIYDKSLKPYDYDIAKAKSLLRKAGWLDRDGDGILDKDGQKFEFEYLIHNAIDVHQKTADIIKESVEKTGIKMNIRMLDISVFGKAADERKFDAIRFAWATNVDEDPYQIFHSSQVERGGSNYIGWRNDKADEIMEKGREIFEADKRWTLFRDLHKLVYEEQPYTFLFTQKETYFYNNKLRNVKFYVSRPGYNLTEWYIDEK